MAKLVVLGSILSLLATQATATNWRQQQDQTRLSGFAGARVKLPFGGPAKQKPSAQLTIAPSRTGVTNSGVARTIIGDGVGLELAGQKPQLMLAGSTVHDLKKSKHKMGISTVGWVGIGVGVAAVIAFGAFYLHEQHIQSCDEGECD